MSNIRTVDAIYTSIAIGMSNSINEQWDNSLLLVEFFDDAANFKGEFFFRMKKNILKFKIMHLKILKNSTKLPQKTQIITGTVPSSL
ncbi:hypothetical protein [Shewanella sp. VB17]|uniref:hypothetical protein n=1 Tax=Shewanella sp. VB17 TaxID=2739432 RepID=UPI0020B7B51E|nr:hypothetical protein [Shewanella sp. VB17]